MLGYPTNDDNVLVPQKVPRTRSTEGKTFWSIQFGGQHCTLLGD